MGHNVDLQHMLGAPAHVKCPVCGHGVRTSHRPPHRRGYPNQKPGEWSLDCDCTKCGAAFTVEIDVKLTVTVQR